ncbi:MAG: sugar ABC transporter permease [Paenibacillus macerans]|uniref:ABC transporter permease subunit n=1 Tax=Paenibacillus macerans TaxID=44252 RepID=A0A090XHB7_PAEMA|nr:sugar ABC transporter permease [Paenibacillus macerans]KFM83817.1 binding--dependent transport system inner membrane component family protein [Paenibacillus macerans]MBS5912426.1 sugar ABC transporter permease [Paenibacillus macerans]MCY7559127.1 sugar ABC transporter permease [Paenibacillus macerans]MDU7472942.1 sugar ABC transporter permease [Paenibacillus macerans]MEC0138216.1 sugar ABC transporter permease [Paenibacillus macerans]
MYNEKTWIDKLKVFMTFGFIPLFAFATVILVPFCMGIFTTLTDWNGTSDTFHFLGLSNYQAALTDSTFWASMGTTLKYVVVTLVLTNVVAFGLALLVTGGFKGQNFFRAGYFTPNLIGGIILGFVWQFIFARVFTYAGRELDWGFLSSSWLGDPDKALWALIIVSIWQNAGYMMLIYVAGLNGISASLTEAASLDGASYIRQLFNVKIPLMVPAFTISLFLTLQRSFMVYDTNLSLTKGDPFRSTELIAMHVYNEAFVYQRFGPGQAKAFILFAVVAIIAIVQVSVMKKVEVEA